MIAQTHVTEEKESTGHSAYFLSISCFLISFHSNKSTKKHSSKLEFLPLA
ncbi:hypothetical protein HanIR_Chr02g0070301 [Helianthus annuus]|nr:hypothetical protein HanIR_Chr02g0070301 [Helianthus annuus]